MSLIDETSSHAQELSFALHLKHAPEKVWRALTDPALLAEWLLPVMGFRLEAGVSFTFQAPPQEGWDGKVHCKLIESEPNKKISYSWVVGELNTRVTFTLTPTEEGTRLSLVHTGFQAHQKHNAAGARYGWRMMSDRLIALLSRE